MASFCFVICVFDEWQLANRLTKQLLANFSDQQIIITTDGTHNVRFKRFCIDNNVLYIPSDKRLFKQKYGGQWLERIFKIFACHAQADYLIRLDADCWVNRGFEHMPFSFLDISGTLQKTAANYPTIQGGCYSVKKSAVYDILDSEYLNDKMYRENPLFGYKRFQHPYLCEGEESSDTIYIGEDHMISHIAYRLNLSIGYWHEIYSQFRGKINQAERYAIIHPVKEIKVA